MTKNTASSGCDHTSARFIKSSDSGQMLQNSVPSIMHTSSEEKPSFTSPISTLSRESATVRKTKPMVSDIRFVLEWNFASSFVSTKPANAPRSSEPAISMSGLTRIDTRLTTPEVSALAMPNETANTIRPTASSSATIGSSRSVSSPFALYWRTTISVAAGAVAEAIAPSVIAAGTERMSGRSRWKPMSAASTKTVATSACITPMTSA